MRHPQRFGRPTTQTWGCANSQPLGHWAARKHQSYEYLGRLEISWR